MRFSLLASLAGALLGCGTDAPVGNGPRAEGSVVALSAVGLTACVTDESRHVYCTGRRTAWGSRVGTASVLERVQGLRTSRAVVIGDRQLCAPTDDGGLRCVGDRSPTRAQPPTPQFDLHPDAPVRDLLSGWTYLCLIDEESRLACWGHDRGVSDQLPARGVLQADLAADWVMEPVLVSTDVASAASSGRHVCTVSTSGLVRCIGANSYGQSGRASGEQWESIDLHAPAAAIGVGSAVTCAVVDRSIWCWGRVGRERCEFVSECYFEQAQADYAARCRHPDPVELVVGGAAAIDVQVAVERACFLDRSGDLRCFAAREDEASPRGAGSMDPVARGVRSFVLVDDLTLCVLHQDGVGWCDGTLAAHVVRRRGDAVGSRLELSVPEVE